MAAVQAAEDALNVAAEDAGETVAGAGEVQATVAAARAAARSAMDSLRRGGGGFGGEGNGGAQDLFASRQVTLGKRAIFLNITVELIPPCYHDTYSSTPLLI